MASSGCTWRDRCHRRGALPQNSRLTVLISPTPTRRFACVRRPLQTLTDLAIAMTPNLHHDLLSFSERSRWVLSFFQAANQARALTFGGKTRSTILPNGRLGLWMRVPRSAITGAAALR